ncbi:LacI family DNA-binding transcriptional regulator [Xylophilus sp. GOD-11R]|uniref:LacI family DNA-binding transcriptional regulator n=1 Tax=Xylophilus sp. GOD-11R TaxID=3089814 RepID=UPI00298D2AB8|nr:LacI family DNA-binding transcriptional regulator [Xylophilus sp. GOD-11R]WPB56974.1 LacI family DNA-binding transcriptional regulator [Xylophilus sp. GOD-11R]
MAATTPGTARMADVAATAGVSLVTVSRALNTPDQVAAPTLAAVQAAVAQLGYLPNMTAGSLASRRSRIVGCLVPSISYPAFSETVEALARTLGDGGYQMLLGQTGYRVEDEARQVDSFLARRVDAIVLTGTNHAAGLRSRLQRSGIPVVETWDLAAAPIDLSVGFSQHEGGRVAGAHLFDCGYRCPAYIGADEDRAMQRLAGLRSIATERGAGDVPAELILPPAQIDDVGLRLSALLARRPDIDAIFCQNDILAAGALFECHRRGWDIPGRIAVMGFGDMPIARAGFPRLSTVRVRGSCIGERAGQLLLARLSGQQQADTAVDIGFEVVRREST